MASATPAVALRIKWKMVAAAALDFVRSTRLVCTHPSSLFSQIPRLWHRLNRAIILLMTSLPPQQQLCSPKPLLQPPTEAVSVIVVKMIARAMKMMKSHSRLILPRTPHPRFSPLPVGLHRRTSSRSPVDMVFEEVFEGNSYQT